MKKIWIAFCAAAFVLAGCSDDKNTSDDGGNHKISLSTETIYTDGDAKTAEVTVTSSSDWRLAGVSDWVHPSAVSGRSGDTVTFTIDRNNSLDSRDAKFKFFTGSAIAVLTVSTEAGRVLELLTSAQMGASNVATTLTVELKTNIEELTYAFSDDGADWVGFDKRSESFGKTKLTFNVKENTDYDDRSCVLTISAPEAAAPLQVNILQSQLNALLIDDNDLMQQFDLSEQYFEIEVKANFEYTVTLSGDWMQDITTRGLDSKKLKIHVDAATASRGGSIVIGNPQFPNLMKTITVVQLNPGEEPLVVPDQMFRDWLIEQGWVLGIGDEACVVLDAGLQATTLTIRGSYYQGLSSVKGIEAFTNLSNIDLYYNKLTELDISALTKVNTLRCESNTDLKLINLGDNPITSFTPFGYYGYLEATDITVISTKLESLDLSMYTGYSPWDNVTWIDVSGCPALESLNCERGNKVQKLYLKTGQVIANLTKNDVTEIVYKD